MMFLLALSASSFATETRTQVMGFNDGVMVDDYNIFRFPGRTFNYPNLAVGEFSIYNYQMIMSETADGAQLDYPSYQEFYNFGVNWQFGDDNPWVVGTYISTLVPMYPQTFSGSNLMNNNLGMNPNRRINLLVGHQLGNNNFGVNLEYIRGSSERAHQTTYNNEITDTTYVYSSDDTKESFTYFNLILGLTEGTSGLWDVALGLDYGTWTDEDQNGFKQTEPDGYYDLSLEGRYFWQKSPKITLVPHGGVMIGKHGSKDYGSYTDPSDTTNYLYSNSKRKSTMLGFDAGMGMHYTSGPDLLAVLDVGIQYGKTKYEVTYPTPDTAFHYNLDRTNEWTNFTLPYLKIGFEGSVFKWMDIRFGATTYWDISKNTQDYNSGSTTYHYMYHYEYKDKEAWNQTYLGFGFHWNRLHVDVMTDPDVFLRGFNFISGDSPRIDSDYYYYNNDYGYMNTKMSVLYEMF